MLRINIFYVYIINERILKDPRIGTQTPPKNLTEEKQLSISIKKKNLVNI